MKAERIGRVLGIGLRVTGRMVGQQLSAAAAAQTRNAQEATARGTAPAADPAVRGRQAGETTRKVSRGLGAFVRPFTRVGGILLLEITGSFYLLFSLAFALYLWKQRTNWQHGLDHEKLIAEAAVAVVFLYLGVSAFWRAGRK
jgi:hypothetical protein